MARYHRRGGIPPAMSCTLPTCMRLRPLLYHRRSKRARTAIGIGTAMTPACCGGSLCRRRANAAAAAAAAGARPRCRPTSRCAWWSCLLGWARWVAAVRRGATLLPWLCSSCVRSHRLMPLSCLIASIVCPHLLASWLLALPPYAAAAAWPMAPPAGIGCGGMCRLPAGVRGGGGRRRLLLLLRQCAGGGWRGDECGTVPARAGEG